VNEIQELRRQGLSISQIGVLSGYDRKTIRKYLEHPKVPRYGPRPKRGSQLEPFEPYIQERLAAGVWNAVVLLAELKERGYVGGYTVVKDYLRPLRRQARAVAVRRFETPPGHQAQVDWGDIGHIETATGRQSVHAFVFTLGHSRTMFVDVATDTKLATLLHLHEAAFAELGGVPREILYDRMKTVVLGTDERGEG
jgi:transposase